MNNKRFVLIHKPVMLAVALPEGESYVSEKSFNVGDDIVFSYFKVINNGIPEDIYDLIRERNTRQLEWDEFKTNAPELASVVSESLMLIGVVF